MDYERTYRRRAGQAVGWRSAETPQPADSAAMLVGPKPDYKEAG